MKQQSRKRGGACPCALSNIPMLGGKRKTNRRKTNKRKTNRRSRK